jgi:DNA-binding HxlR family transcriptional regulator
LVRDLIGDAAMKRLPRTFGCAVELSLELLGGKWKPIILARLKDGPLRYGELRRLTPSLSDKMLTERLADLQAVGLNWPLQRGVERSPTSTERSPTQAACWKRSSPPRPK